MKAIILAGGKGARLKPYTTVFPKPLVPIGSRPILDIIIRQLARDGFRDITLTVGPLAELIRAYFHDIETRLPDVHLTYLEENEPLGTAGPVAMVKNPGPDPFLVMNGDVLTTLPFAKMMDYHRGHSGVLTIGMYTKKTAIDFGILETDAAGRVTGYAEKPEKVFPISMGVYIYSPAVLKYIPANERLDFPDLVRRLLASGEPVMSYPFQDFWLDIGNPDDYEKANEAFEQRKDEFPPD
jgi:NDP-sugar pyrophosphorylase family protein